MFRRWVRGAGVRKRRFGEGDGAGERGMISGDRSGLGPPHRRLGPEAYRRMGGGGGRGGRGPWGRCRSECHKSPDHKAAVPRPSAHGAPRPHAHKHRKANGPGLPPCPPRVTCRRVAVSLRGPGQVSLGRPDHCRPPPPTQPPSLSQNHHLHHSNNDSDTTTTTATRCRYTRTPPSLPRAAVSTVAMGGAEVQPPTATPPKHLAPLKPVGGGGQPDWGTPTSIPHNDPLVALIILNTHMRGFFKK